MRERQSDKKRSENRSRLIAGVFSFSFSAAILFGVRLDSVDNVDIKDGTLWIQLVTLGIIFTGLVRLLWRLFDMLQSREEAEKKAVPNKITNVLERADRHTVPLSFFFLLLCWLPVFLAVYPGFFVYDAQDEYVQVATRTFSTHHPLVHVLLLGGMVCGGHKLTGSYNPGIACYTVLQMLLAADGGDVYPVLGQGRAFYAGFAAFADLSFGDGDGRSFFCVKGLEASLCAERYGHDASSKQRVLCLSCDDSLPAFFEKKTVETAAFSGGLRGGGMSFGERRLKDGASCAGR